MIEKNNSSGLRRGIPCEPATLIVLDEKDVFFADAAPASWRPSA